MVHLGQIFVHWWYVCNSFEGWCYSAVGWGDCALCPFYTWCSWISRSYLCNFHKRSEVNNSSCYGSSYNKTLLVFYVARKEYYQGVLRTEAMNEFCQRQLANTFLILSQPNVTPDYKPKHQSIVVRTEK